MLAESRVESEISLYIHLAGASYYSTPEDILRVQEVIYSVKPDVIIETGIAHGGSLIYYASLCKIMGKGRVIGIDIEIRPHNRKAIESHELSSYITLIEGNSIDEKIVAQVKSLVKTGEKGFVILDSNHTKQHVLNELEAYHDLVTPARISLQQMELCRNYMMSHKVK